MSNWSKSISGFFVALLLETPEFISGNNKVYWTCQNDQKTQTTLVSLLRFAKEPLVVTFGETRAHISRKCVLVQGMNVKKSSREHKLVCLLSPIFAWE